jgi:Hedgehog amino-terminal signalling domain
VKSTHVLCKGILSAVAVQSTVVLGQVPVFDFGQKWPTASEAESSGAAVTSVDGSHLVDLVNSCSHNIVIKFEEMDCSDARMTENARRKMLELAILVTAEWSGKVNLRVTEAWDTNNEHSNYSLHYEGRAIDITTDDLDLDKYRRLAGLAAEVGFDWVYLESDHVHVSVRR